MHAALPSTNSLPDSFVAPPHLLRADELPLLPQRVEHGRAGRQPLRLVPHQQLNQLHSTAGPGGIVLLLQQLLCRDHGTCCVSGGTCSSKQASKHSKTWLFIAAFTSSIM
jgi:hypothetical protein